MTSTEMVSPGNTESNSEIDANYVRMRPVRMELVDDNLFLIDQKRLTIDMLDPLGAFIWELLLVPTNIKMISELVFQIFPDTDIAKIQADVGILLHKFVESEWISKE